MLPLVWSVGIRSHSIHGLCPERNHGAQHDRGYSRYGSPYDVKRSLYIGDTLYTLSQKQILANSLTQINKTIATIPLPEGGDVLYPDMKGM